MTSTKQVDGDSRQGRTLKALVGCAAVALLCACGGGSDGPTTPGMATLQKDREQAALARAHALNADAMGKIKAERASGQR